jgi:excisionase family DNA binding protein
MNTTNDTATAATESRRNRIALLCQERLLLSTAQVAFVMAVSTKTVRRMLEENTIPAPTRPGCGRLLRWRSDVLLEWVDLDCPPVDDWQAWLAAGRPNWDRWRRAGCPDREKWEAFVESGCPDWKTWMDANCPNKAEWEALNAPIRARVFRAGTG